MFNIAVDNMINMEKMILVKSTDLSTIWRMQTFQYQLSALLGFVFYCRKVNHEQDFVDAVKSIGYNYDGY
jgi:hypothetical protein